MAEMENFDDKYFDPLKLKAEKEKLEEESKQIQDNNSEASSNESCELGFIEEGVKKDMRTYD